MSLLINYNLCGHVEPVSKYIDIIRVFKFDQLTYFEYINFCQLIEKTLFVENIKPLQSHHCQKEKNFLYKFQNYEFQTGFKIKIY